MHQYVFDIVIDLELNILIAQDFNFIIAIL
jgi:hypothetical protein